MSTTRQLRIVAATGAVAVLIGGAVWLLAPPNGPRAPTVSTAEAPGQAVGAGTAVSTPAVDPAQAPGPAVLDPPGAASNRPIALTTAVGRTTPVPVIRVRANGRVATVNGVVLTGADLGIVAERSLSPERHAFLLNAAIDHALANQAAEAAGVTLSDSQRRALEEHRAGALERDPAVGDTVGHHPEAVEHSLRVLTTAMLLESVGAERGIPGRHVTTEQVSDHYAAHAADYDALPSDPAERAQAWRSIEIAIRQALAADTALDHAEALEELRASLRAAATIEVFR